jgi:hypothetical protein
MRATSPTPSCARTKVTTSPGVSSAKSSASSPVPSFGPGRSRRMVIWRPARPPRERGARHGMVSVVPCEKFSCATSMPARSSARAPPSPRGRADSGDDFGAAHRAGNLARPCITHQRSYARTISLGEFGATKVSIAPRSSCGAGAAGDERQQPKPAAGSRRGRARVKTGVSRRGLERRSRLVAGVRFVLRCSPTLRALAPEGGGRAVCCG